MAFSNWLMALSGIWMIFILVFVLGWLVCLFYVLVSDRSSGGAKFGWFLITFFFHWLGFAVFLIVTQKPRAQQATGVNRIEPSFERQRNIAGPDFKA